MRHRGKLRAPKQPAAENTLWRGNVWMTWGLAAFCAYAVVDSLQHSFLAAVFPGVMALLSLLCCVLYLWRQRLMTIQTAMPEGQISAVAMMRAMLWLVGLAVLTCVFGFVIAISALFAALLRMKAGASWKMTALLSVCGIGGMLFLAHYARMDFPWGLLQHYADLPWPLG